jgi:hypothetical protein
VYDLDRAGVDRLAQLRLAAELFSAPGRNPFSRPLVEKSDAS